MVEAKELPEDGYEDIREYIVTTWKYIQIENRDGEPLTRIETTDRRAYWVRQIGSPTLEMRVIISGTDPDIISLYQTGGITIGASTLHKTIDEPEIRSRVEYIDVTIDEPEDTVLLCHQVHVPDVGQTAKQYQP